jgi:hypothetical protein
MSYRTSRKWDDSLQGHANEFKSITLWFYRVFPYGILHHRYPHNISSLPILYNGYIFISVWCLIIILDLVKIRQWKQQGF